MTYVDLATLKLSLSINASDATRDALLNKAIAGAERAINNRARRRFDLLTPASQRVYRLRGPRAIQCGEVLVVEDIGSTSGLIVEGSTDGTTYTTIDPTAYSTDPDNALARNRPITGIRYVGKSWWQFKTARITAQWGWPAIPDDIIEAALLWAARLYRRKDSPEGVAGSADWGLVRLPNLDPDVRKLVDLYRRNGVG